MYWSKNGAVQPCYSDRLATLCCGFKKEFEFLNIFVVFQKHVNVQARRFRTASRPLLHHAYTS
jgi:hypothetical protein